MDPSIPQQLQVRDVYRTQAAVVEFSQRSTRKFLGFCSAPWSQAVLPGALKDSVPGQLTEASLQMVLAESICIEVAVFA